jgi:type IV pilus assembly protein PilN
MILINLLPHREIGRRHRRRGFLVGLVVSAVLGMAAVATAQQALARITAAQTSRNAVLEAGIARLDSQLRDIAALRRDIAALLARQQAVETLQRDRNEPVLLLEELVERTPANVQLRSIRQTGQEVTLTGWAQTNEAVSQMLRSMALADRRFSRAELLEIRAVTPPRPEPGVEARRVFEFSLRLVARGGLGGAQAPAVRAATGS